MEKQDSKSLSENFLTKSFKLVREGKVLTKKTSYESILEYFRANYFDDDKFSEEEIKADTLTLKTYRDYLEFIEKNRDYLINCLIVLITIIGIFLPLAKSVKSIKDGVHLILYYFAIILINFWARNLKSSVHYKIRVCNKIIYILEDLRQEKFYKNKN